MNKLITHSIFLTIFLAFSINNLFSQEISGPTYVEVDSIATFTNSAGYCSPNCAYYWMFFGNPTVHSYSQAQVVLEWDEPGLHTVLLYYADAYIDTLMDNFTPVVYIPQRQIEFSYDASGNRIQRSIIQVIPGGLKSIGSLPEKKPDKPEQDQNIKLYPNPAKETVFIAMSEEYLEDETVLHIMDNIGRILKQVVLHDAINEIDASSFKNGSYIFRISNGTNMHQWIVIKN